MRDRCTISRLYFAVLLAASVVSTDSEAQATQIARNRYTQTLAYQVEPVPDSGGSVGRVRLRTTNGFLAIPVSHVQVVSDAAARDWSAYWVMTRTPDGFVRFVSQRMGSPLHVETGTAAVGAIRADMWSAMWAVAPGTLFPTTTAGGSTSSTSGGIILTNRWKPEIKLEVERMDVARIRLRTASGQYLTVVNGRLTLTATPAPVTTGPLSPSDFTLSPVSPRPVDCAECYFWAFSELAPGSAVNIENGPIAVGPIQPDWWSAMWVQSPGRLTASTPVAPAAPLIARNRWRDTVTLQVVTSVDTNYVNLRSATGYYVMENERLTVSSAPGGMLGMWALVKIPNTQYVRLRNRVTGDYLHIEHGPIAVAKLALGTPGGDWWSAHWTVGR